MALEKLYFIIPCVLGSVPYVDVAVPVVKLISDCQQTSIRSVKTSYLQPIGATTQMNWITGTRHRTIGFCSKTCTVLFNV